MIMQEQYLYLSGRALLYVYEELAQHYGQMEILRGCVLAEFVPCRGERP
jgi:hypothetical protein